MKKQNTENRIFLFNLMLGVLDFLTVLFSAWTATTSFTDTDFI